MFNQKFDANERATAIALTIVELKAINKYYTIKTKLKKFTTNKMYLYLQYKSTGTVFNIQNR